MSDNIPQQSVGAKKAEFQRPFSGNKIFEDPKLKAMHLGRAKAALVDLADLDEKHVSLSPFIEIGAGSVQRSIALINSYQIDGVATDISQRSLADAPYILSLLKHRLTPMLICCDAHHLPFLPNTFRFAFAYQTLHHFQNPIPVVAECYRVIGKGGYLFFNEEPMDSSFRRLLRGKRMLTHPPTTAQKIGHRLGIEKVFWDDGTLERSLGITEARFDVDLWRKALQPFKKIEIEVNKKLKIRSNLREPRLNSFLAGIIGGNVKGLCQKTDGNPATGDFRERLMCLDCTSTRLERIENQQLVCGHCHRAYPISEGVIRMLPIELESRLNPDNSASSRPQ